MKKQYTLGVVIALCLVFIAGTALGEDIKTRFLTEQTDGEIEYIPGEVLVKFEEGVSPEQIEDLNQGFGSAIKSQHRGRVKKLHVPPGQSEKGFIDKLKSDHRVKSASLNTVCHAFDMIPNDPQYPYQWNFPKINCPQAWDISTGTDVTVAILDTGIAYEDHAVPDNELHTVRSYVTDYLQAPDLAGTSFVQGHDFINNDEHPNDNGAHGTHVAGIIAQTTNNWLGTAGMAFNCNLMPVKVLSYFGVGTVQTVSDGIYWATDNGAQVINMSLGWTSCYDPGDVVHDAIKYAYDHGVVLVAASGNRGIYMVAYPARYIEVIAVGATRYDDTRTAYSQYGSGLEVMSPGGDMGVDQNEDGLVDGILQETFTAYDRVSGVLPDPTDFGLWLYSGTSMAAPHVTALCAMMIAKGQTGIENIRSILHDTAVDLGSPGWDRYYGHGRIDAYAALTYSPPPVQAGSFTETVDAGELANTSQSTIGCGELTEIYGSLTTSIDVDIYKIRVTDRDAFQVSVSQANGPLALVILNTDGRGKYATDGEGRLDPLVGCGGVGGSMLLAICSPHLEPYDADGHSLFPGGAICSCDSCKWMSPSCFWIGPECVYIGPLAYWDLSAPSCSGGGVCIYTGWASDTQTIGDYTITFKGATFAQTSVGCDMTTVPNVVGMTQEAAETAIINANLQVGTITEQYSTTVPAGSVISQDPADATWVVFGTIVDMVVSLGPEMTTVPNVVGMTQEAAETAIINANLQVGTITEQYSTTVPAGSVISQDPADGTSVVLNSTVDLVVSLGPVEPGVAPTLAPTGGGIYQISYPVTLGGEVSDLNGDLVTYEWSEGGEFLFSGEVQTTFGGEPVDLPTHTISNLGLGDYTITLSVNDETDNLVTSDIVVKVVDEIPPELPQTGQKQCYDASGNVIDCTADGQTQDGAVQAGADWPDPRFTDNGDGTVTDKLTWLMWLKDGSCLGSKNWTGALNKVDDFNANPSAYGCFGYNASYSDWHLPNIAELDSLVHPGYNEEDCGGSPCGGVYSWLNTQGFHNVQNSKYWSGTSRTDQLNYAMIVYMGSGYVGSYQKYIANRVWPVRVAFAPPAKVWKTGQKQCYDEDGNVIDCADGQTQDGAVQAGADWPDPMFTDNEDGTVTDNLTGLMWLQDANLPGTSAIWQNTLDYVDTLNSDGLCGYYDWRLPNRKELFSLIDFSQHDPPLQSGHPFVNVRSGSYWSSTSGVYPTKPMAAWLVNMTYGSVSGNGKSSYCYLWPVRGPVTNQPPEANAGDNLAITSEDQDITVVQGTATDPDNDPLTYRWLEGETVLLDSTGVGENGEAHLDLSLVQGFSIGEHILTLEVNDGQATSTDEMRLIIENSAPHAAPLGAGVYEINTEVIVSGNVSDFDGDLLDYQWMEGTNVLFSGEVQTILGGEPVDLQTHNISNLGLGNHTITLSVTDGINDPVTKDITVEVIDATAPTLAPVPYNDKTILWPPNHDMVDIEIQANASDNSGGLVISAIVSSNEPEDGLGDGDMAPDWTEPVIDQSSGIITFQLRAERSGSGDGRIYTIKIKAMDDTGNSSSADVEIIVPHDKRKK